MEQLAQRAGEVARKRITDREVLYHVAEFGILGLAFPEDCDSSGKRETRICIAVEPEISLAELVRFDLGLTGPKILCHRRS
jgi:hypothetical protein